MYRVGVDVGGTFTDLVALNEETGEFYVAKCPTTKNPIHGVMSVFRKARVPTESVGEIVHGTTVATNAILQRKLEQDVAFVATTGYRDLPFIQKTWRRYHYDLHWDKPTPLVKRRNCFEIDERINYKGRVLRKMDVKRAKGVVQEIKKRNIVAIAVCFLFSYVNPVHEIHMRRLIRRMHPRAEVSLSHEVDPQWREYERSSTTIADAYLRPLVSKYASDLALGLRKEKVQARLLLMKSNGGMTDYKAARRNPVAILNSGPVGGVLGGAYFCRLLGLSNAITMDMGGTSFDVSLITNGGYRYTTETEVEWNIPVRVPMVDVVSIGTGGGSIAWVDKGGLLRVGPQSAEADPGPACYGKGGLNPTVTDANLLLGRLNPDYFLGGEMKLEALAAEKTMLELSKKTGMDLFETALSVIGIANNNMANAIGLVSLGRGVDPRTCILISFGGAASLQASQLARISHVKKVIVPANFIGGFSAFGLLTANMRVDQIRTAQMRSDRLDLGKISKILQSLRRKSIDSMRLDGYKGDVTIVQEIKMRYLGQAYGLNIQIPVKDALTEEDLQQACQGYHETHKAQYGYAIEGEVIEFLDFKTTALGLVAPPVMSKLGPREKAKPKSRRRVMLDAKNGFVECPIYERSHLGEGFHLDGPALIEEEYSTILVDRNDHASVDGYGDLVMEIGE